MGVRTFHSGNVREKAREKMCHTHFQIRKINSAIFFLPGAATFEGDASILPFDQGRTTNARHKRQCIADGHGQNNKVSFNLSENGEFSGVMTEISGVCHTSFMSYVIVGPDPHPVRLRPPVRGIQAAPKGARHELSADASAGADVSCGQAEGPAARPSTEPGNSVRGAQR